MSTVPEGVPSYEETAQKLMIPTARACAGRPRVRPSLQGAPAENQSFRIASRSVPAGGRRRVRCVPSPLHGESGDRRRVARRRELLARVQLRGRRAGPARPRSPRNRRHTPVRPRPARTARLLDGEEHQSSRGPATSHPASERHAAHARARTAPCAAGAGGEARRHCTGVTRSGGNRTPQQCRERIRHAPSDSPPLTTKGTREHESEENEIDTEGAEDEGHGRDREAREAHDARSCARDHRPHIHGVQSREGPRRLGNPARAGLWPVLLGVR